MISKEAYDEFITSSTFYTIWVVVAVLLVAGIMVAHAIKTNRDRLHCGFSAGELFIMILYSLIWPGTLMLTAMVAPFYGIYRLALYIANEVTTAQTTRDLMKGATNE